MREKRNDRRISPRPCQICTACRWLFLLVVSVSIMACFPFLEEEPSLEIRSRIYDGSEKIVRRAIVSVFREQGYRDIHETPQGAIETDYVTSGNWRSRAAATTKKHGRRKCEVILELLAEKKTSSAWERRSIMGKEQYDKFFDVIELQVYREMSQDGE